MNSPECNDLSVLCSAQNISISYGSAQILNNCTVTLYTHETALLLGKNGAGKSTLLKILAQALSPDSGSVVWNCSSVGYLAQDFQMYGGLTVAENLNFFARLSGYTIKNALAIWGLEQYRDTLFNALSKGLQQRAALCRTFAAPHEYLLLDEPTTHLDVAGIELFTLQLQEFRERPGSLGVLLASHDIANLASFAHRALVLDGGRVEAGSIGTAGIGAAIDTYRMKNR